MDRISEMTLSIEEYKGYQPFLEEVASVAISQISHITNASQVLSYIRYFIQKGEESSGFWYDLDEAISRNLSNMSSEGIFNITEVLKANGLLKHELGVAISKELRDRIKEMDINDMPVATVIICAFNQQNDSFIADLEDGLLGEEVKNEDSESRLPEERINQMTPEMFATMCSQINAHRLPLFRFISASKSYVTKHLEAFTPLQLGHVLLPYSALSRDFSLARKAEKLILNIGRNLSVID